MAYVEYVETDGRDTIIELACKLIDDIRENLVKYEPTDEVDTVFRALDLCTTYFLSQASTKGRELILDAMRENLSVMAKNAAVAIDEEKMSISEVLNAWCSSSMSKLLGIERKMQ